MAIDYHHKLNDVLFSNYLKIKLLLQLEEIIKHPFITFKKPISIGFLKEKQK